MGMVVERGFTVIELMLFLAISGLLLVSLMIGVGNNITQQRYRDEVASFKALLQDQYAEVLTPQNTDLQISCKDPSSSVPPTVSVRGTTKCVLLGKVIEIQNTSASDPSSVKISNAIGYESSILNDNTNDIDALTAYKPTVSTYDQQTERLNVGVRNTIAPACSGGSTPPSWVILILRSPVSGLTKVFLSNGQVPGTGDLAGVIGGGFALCRPSDTVRKFCIDGDTGSLPKQIISIDSAAAGSSSVLSSDSAQGECA